MAASQAACKNSSLVFFKSSARVLIRSRDRIMCSELSGMNSNTGTIAVVNTGASDSMPATGMALAIFSNISPRFGNSAAISLALEATSGVISSSLAG